MFKNEIKTGTIVASGAAMNIELGFLPDEVEIINETTSITLNWLKSMGAGKGHKAIAAGTKSFIATGGVSQYAGEAPGKQLAGTGATTAGSATLTGTTTAFTSELRVGDVININGEQRKVTAIASATSLTVDAAFEKTVAAANIYRQTGRETGLTLGADSINTATNVLHYAARRSD
jgi:hypothetical protein